MFRVLLLLGEIANPSPLWGAALGELRGVTYLVWTILGPPEDVFVWWENMDSSPGDVCCRCPALLGRVGGVKRRLKSLYPLLVGEEYYFSSW